MKTPPSNPNEHPQPLLEATNISNVAMEITVETARQNGTNSNFDHSVSLVVMHSLASFILVVSYHLSYTFVNNNFHIVYESHQVGSSSVFKI